MPLIGHYTCDRCKYSFECEIDVSGGNNYCKCGKYCAPKSEVSKLIHSDIILKKLKF